MTWRPVSFWCGVLLLSGRNKGVGKITALRRLVRGADWKSSQCIHARRDRVTIFFRSGGNRSPVPHYGGDGAFEYLGRLHGAGRCVAKVLPNGFQVRTQEAGRLHFPDVTAGGQGRGVAAGGEMFRRLVDKKCEVQGAIGVESLLRAGTIPRPVGGRLGTDRFDNSRNFPDR